MVFPLVAAVLMGIGQWMTPATATELPPTVMTYLQEKDATVKVRFDGMITFSNGQVYLPVFPQDPAMPLNPSQVLIEEPGGAEYPDLVQFDNNLFLIRLINTATGKLALAKLDIYPIELKEGLLPQDLLLPPNLYIPTELKVILGDLPYNPGAVSSEIDTPAEIASVQFDVPDRAEMKKTVYLADIDRQALVVYDPILELRKEEIRLDCVTSSILPSGSGQTVYVSCLTTNELVAVDTHSNLIKTRIPVGSKPSGIALIEDQAKLMVSHRYSNFLSMISTDELVAGTKILLPGNGGEMVYAPSRNALYVADYSSPNIYELDLTTLKVLRTLPAMKNISALWMEEHADGEPKSKKKSRLWMASRSQNRVVALEPDSGRIVASFEVGVKPVAFAAVDRRLYVVSASSDRVEIIDLEQNQLLSPISLSTGAFPTGISLAKGEHKAYVSAAGTDLLYVIDLRNAMVERTLPVEARGMGLALIGPSAPPDGETETDLPAPPVQTLEPLIPEVLPEDVPPAEASFDEPVGEALSRNPAARRPAYAVPAPSAETGPSLLDVPLDLPADFLGVPEGSN